MNALKVMLTAIPTPLAFVLLVCGGAVVLLMAARLGYGLYIAKTVKKWIIWAEENISGDKMGAERKAKIVELLRGMTPDWLDWAITDKTLDFIVQIVFNFTKKKLDDYMEKKSAETTTVAHFGNVGEDNKNRKE